MKLINVRLDPDDERRAEALQKSGITVSEVVRNAIRQEYERRVGAARRRFRTGDLIDEMLRRFPTTERAAVDSSDTRGAREYIRAKLSRRRR